MQIPSALSPSFNFSPAASQQQYHATEGTTAHADNHANAGAPAPAAPPAESSGLEKNSSDRPRDTERSKENPEDAGEKDPLKDTSSEEYAQVKELQARDREVRAHEQAHLNAAGQYATSGPTYSYQTGPDGQQYAIGGEVGIDVSTIPNDPEATIAKMQVVQRAAMAPAEPSGQDIRVAAQAAQAAAAARAELISQQFEESQGGDAKPMTEPDSNSRQTATAIEAQSSYQDHQHEKEAPGLFEAVA